MREKFKNKEDRNLHLLAMTIITSWVNTQTGQFYLSVRKFAEELECSEKKARRVINNLIRWGYIRKISDSPNQYGQSIYELSTYNFDIEKGTPKDTPKQINNELTNNEITNNEEGRKIFINRLKF